MQKFRKHTKNNFKINLTKIFSVKNIMNTKIYFLYDLHEGDFNLHEYIIIFLIFLSYYQKRKGLKLHAKQPNGKPRISETK